MNPFGPRHLTITDRLTMSALGPVSVALSAYAWQHPGNERWMRDLAFGAAPMTAIAIVILWKKGRAGTGRDTLPMISSIWAFIQSLVFTAPRPIDWPSFVAGTTLSLALAVCVGAAAIRSGRIRAQ